MRIRPPRGRSLFFLAAFLLALFALLPLRLGLSALALHRSGFTAREARGSLWFGALGEARLGPVELGDVEARLRLLPLLVGRARLDLARGGEGDRLEGALVATRHGFGVDDVSGRLGLGPAAQLPLSSLEFDRLSVHFEGGLCRRAEGRVKAATGGEAGGIPLPASLAGSVRCDGGALLLPLAGAAGMERLDLRLRGDGSYRADLSVRPGDGAARERLAAAGFTPAGNGWVLRFEGRF